jgi:acylphosphatase
VSAAERVARRVEVTGRVQGVFFRESARREAARHGVAGWVANRPDGAVEAVFEGEPDAVDAMVEWARRGPVHATVSGVVVHDEAVEGLDGFTVR